MMPEGALRVFTKPRSRKDQNPNEETTMNKMLAGLLLSGAVVVSVNNWFPTEARMATYEPLQAEAISAQIEDDVLPVEARQAAGGEQWQPGGNRAGAVGG